MDHRRGERSIGVVRLALLAAMLAVGSGANSCNCRGNRGSSDDPPAPGTIVFSLPNYAVSAYAGTATLTVNRVNGTLGAVTIQYSTSDGTATVADSDYTAIAPTTLSWADGDATPQIITVLFPGSDDLVLEPAETFNLNFTNPMGGVLAGPSATVTLVETFTKFPGNPVIAGGTGTWDNQDVEGPCVIKTGATSYVMYYEGGDINTDYVGRATSPDGVTWTRGSAPLITPTQASAVAVWRPWALFDGATWHLWYTRVIQVSAGPPATYNYSIGYATSTDPAGATGWTVQNGGNAVFMNGAAATFDESSVAWACVILDAGTFKMWYTAFSTTAVSIGYTTSANGSTWTGARTQVLTATGGANFDAAVVFQPCVIKDAATYRMWFVGENTSLNQNWQIGYATSATGTSWTRYAGNPVIANGIGTAWDSLDAYYPGVIRDGDVFKMWYTGRTDLATYTTWQIGYATNP